MVNEVGVGAQSEFGHEEPEVILAGNEVGSGRHMNHDIDLDGLQLGINQGGTCRPERQIPVIEPAIGPGSLAPPTELVVQSPFVDAEVFDHPLGLKGPPVRANGTQILEDFLVGDWRSGK